jgi:manganese oxidase
LGDPVRVTRPSARVGLAITSMLVVLAVTHAPVAQADPRIAANDNRRAAGVLRDGVLTLHLEIVEARWFPQAEDGDSVVVQALRERGGGPQVPGPLVRVPQGTTIHVTVHNLLQAGTAVVHGLHDGPAPGGAPLEVPAGERRERRFVAGAPGTYHYWATTTGRSLTERFAEDAHLSGALVVDAPGAPTDDRVFVIGLWGRDPDPTVAGDEGAEMLSVNGKAWPYSERLTHRVGDTVRWRWVNTSVSSHPMHLHGSYFRVDSVGDGVADRIYAPAEQRLAVTEHVAVGGTITTTWQPDRAGRWLFHCQMTAHISPDLSVVNVGSQQDHHGRHDPADEFGMAAASGMKGLVVGITVIAAGDEAAAVSTPLEPRRMRLLVREKPATWSHPKMHVFQLQEGPGEPDLQAAAAPGPVIVLTRDEPTEIEVVNQLSGETAVHWHGMELESYYDGVPGWGGLSHQVTPAIAPGGSFVAKMTPPRAGTFIYHTHWHDELQLATGMYGAMLVLDPGQRHDPETDRVFVISLGGPRGSRDPVLLNGTPAPRRARLRAGVTYRFRFINITPNNAGLRVHLREANGGPVRWRALAKDGADLPASQAVLQPAELRISVGETYDFELRRDEPGTLELEVLRPAGQTRVVQALQFDAEEP